MATNWDKEQSVEYWSSIHSETFPGYMERVARQLAAMSGKLVKELTQESLSPEAAERLIDSLGGSESSHVSSEIMQGSLVAREIADAERDEDAATGS